MVGVLVTVVFAVFAPLIARYAPTATSFGHVLEAPFSPGHLLGTDELGRDVFSRLVFGTQPTLEVGVLATLLAMLVAVPIGVGSGYFGGALDMVAMRITDILLAFPFLLIAVGLAAIFGPSLQNVILALGIGLVPGTIRIARGEALALREQEFVQAAIVTGVSDFHILWRHLIPNMASPLIVQTTVSIPGAILGSAALSYLGLGLQPPAPDWGDMLTSAQTYLYNDPLLAVLPGIAIFLTALSFNLVGDGLRDFFDPSLR
jgi:peptide/nickel transport system permease protein